MPRGAGRLVTAAIFDRGLELVMLRQFGHEIWTADGSDVVAMLGFRYPTRMAVIRLSRQRPLRLVAGCH